MDMSLSVSKKKRLRQKRANMDFDRHCEGCNEIISKRNISGFCRTCNIKTVVEKKPNLEEIPAKFKHKYYGALRRYEELKGKPIRTCWKILKSMDYDLEKDHLKFYPDYIEFREEKFSYYEFFNL